MRRAWAVAAGALLGTAALAGNTGPRIVTSNHWAGYMVTGHRYTAVAGIFTVPTLNTTSCNPMAVEWVGLGGRGHALLQAGVAETCHRLLPWWYELPADWTVHPLRRAPTILQWGNGQATLASPGNQVQVTISRVVPGVWTVDLADLTTGGTWKGTVGWTGTAPSAEWIVENPTTTGDKACTWHPTPRAAYCPMPAFSSVKFNDLSVSPTSGTWTVLRMRDRSGQIVASPGPLTPTGFVVNYSPIRKERT